MIDKEKDTSGNYKKKEINKDSEYLCSFDI